MRLVWSNCVSCKFMILYEVILENEIIQNYFNKTIIFCWTINDNNILNNIVDNSFINGIVTDYPVKFLNIMNNK